MVVPDFEKRNTLDEAFRKKRAVEQRFFGLFAPCRAQPCGQRNAEATFATVQYLLRQQVGKGRFQNMLAVIAVEFEIPWKGGGEFGQFVVEKRRTDFQRAGHAGDIDFCQHIAWHIGVDVQFGASFCEIRRRQRLFNFSERKRAVVVCDVTQTWS